MVLKNENNKVIIELNEDELIYKRFFRRIKIKKSNVRSVFYDESFLGILTYSGKIYSLNISSLLWSENGKLEELRKELNKENILFDYTNVKVIRSYFPFYLIFLPMLNVDLEIELKIILLLICIIGILYIKSMPRNNSTVFNIDKDELEIVRLKRLQKYKRHEVDKIELKRYFDEVTTIEFKKNENKFVIYFKDTPYLIKIYNLSLIKLFKQ